MLGPSWVLCSWDFGPPPQPEHLGLFLLARKCGGSQGCVREHLTSAGQECSPEHFKKPGSLHRFTPVGGCVGALLFHHLLYLFLFQILTEADRGWALGGQILWPRPGMNQAGSHSRELVSQEWESAWWCFHPQACHHPRGLTSESSFMDPIPSFLTSQQGCLAGEPQSASSSGQSCCG